MTFVSMSLSAMISHVITAFVVGAVIGGLIVYSATKSIVR